MAWSYQFYSRSDGWMEYGYWHSYSDSATITQTGVSASGISLTIRRQSSVVNFGVGDTSFTFSYGGQSIKSGTLIGASNGEGSDSKDVSVTVAFPASWVGNTISFTGGATGTFVFDGYGQFTFSLDAAEKNPVTVTRTASPRAAAETGELASGAAVYSKDELRIDASLAPGYKGEVEFNGEVIESGATKTVEGDISVASTAEPMATLHIWNGESWDMYLIYVYGTEWQLHQVNIHNGAEWEKYY